MEVPIQSDNLKLILPNGKGSDFFVRSMVLDEGLGIIPTARLELCSSAPGSVVEMKELKGHLGSAAAVEFKHINVMGDGVTSVVSTRWMSGLVAAVEHLGVVYSQRDGSDPVCGYRMTIRPSLARLCLRRSRYQFANKTVREVLETLLKSCCNNGEYDFPGQGCDVLNATRDFSQGDETDYEFFVRVLASCGLSYDVQMNKADASPIAPTLHVISAHPTNAQLSVIEANDSSADTSKVTLYYKNVKADGCIGSMTAWEMSQSEGVEGCSVSFGDAGGTSLSGEVIETDKKNVVRLNHVPFDNVRSADEVKEEVGVYLKSMRRNDSVWLGVTSRLEARVGAALELRGFYGKEGPSIKDLMIARTRVRLESRIPAGLLAPQGSDGWRQYVSVGCISTAKDAATDFSALPTGRLGEDEAFGGTRASGEFSHVEKVVSTSTGTGGGSKVQVNVEEDWRKAAGTADAWQSATAFVQATVCTNTGSVDSKNSTCALRAREVNKQKDVFYEFYATPDNADSGNRVMVVRYVQPVGGLGQGLFRVPRVGDRILVVKCSPSGASVGGINYLMGYLPGKDMEFTTNKELARTTGAALSSEMMALRFQPAGSEPDDPAKNNAIAIRRGKSENKCSELSFYNTHDGKMWNPFSNFEEEQDGFEDGLSDQASKTLANFQSTGSMQLSANNRIEMNARNIHIGCPGWKDPWRKVKQTDKKGKTKEGDRPVDGKVVVDDISELIVRANRRIVLNVGASTLVIDKDGILLNSSRWRWSDGMSIFDSYVAVNGLTGVSISGSTVNAEGALSARFGDSAGAGITADAGVAGLTGAIVRQKTMSRCGMLGKAAGLAAGLGMGIFNAISGEKDPKSADKYSTWGAALGNSLDTLFACKDQYTNGEDSVAAVQAASVLRLVSSLFDIIAYCVKLGVGEKRWETEAYSDVFTSLSLASKTAAWAVLYVAVSWKNSKGTSFAFDETGILGKITKVANKLPIAERTSAVTLKTSGIYVNTSEYENFTLSMQKGNGPLAGTVDSKSVNLSSKMGGGLVDALQPFGDDLLND